MLLWRSAALSSFLLSEIPSPLDTGGRLLPMLGKFLLLSRARVAIIAAAALAATLIATAPAARATTPLYPDLVTLPPSEFQFDRVEIDGEFQEVMRFTTTTLNR